MKTQLYIIFDFMIKSGMHISVNWTATSLYGLKSAIF